MRQNKRTIFIVSQDIFLVQTYSGFLGTVFKNFYLFLFSLRLKILLKLLTKDSKVILLTSKAIDQQKQKIEVFLYSDQLAELDISKYRKRSLKTVSDISRRLVSISKESLEFKGINSFVLWRTQTAARLSYYYYPYLEAIERLIKKYKPDFIWILGKSKEEKIASFLADKNKIKLNKFFVFNLSWLNSFIQKYLFSKQLGNKQKDFLKKTKKNCLGKYEDCQRCYLLSADFFRHLKILVPLYKKFKEKGEKVFFVLDFIGRGGILQKIYKIDRDYFFSAEGLSSKEANKKISFYREEFKKIFFYFRKIKQASFLEIFRTMEDYFEPLIKEGLPLAKIYLEAGERIVKKLKPKGIVCHNDMRFQENALLQMAKKYKIKALIAHSEILSGDKTNTFDADYFSAAGDHIKDELLKLGYSARKIFVNGDPRLDFLAQRKTFDKREIYKKLGLPLEKKIVLLISDRPNPVLSLEEKRKQFCNVSRAVKEIGNIQLVIKPHPTEKRENLLSDLKKWQIRNALLTDNSKIELFEILSVALVGVIAWSMVGFEAMLFEVPVIVANFTDKDYDLKIPYVKMGGAVKADSLGKLKRYIRMFCNENGKKRKKQIKKGLNFCRYYYRLPFGKASERIVDLISRE